SHAKNPPTAARQHHQTVAHSCRCVQSGLVMRKISGCGTPRGFQGGLNAFLFFIPLLWKVSVNAIPRQWPLSEPHEVTSLKNATPFRMPVLCLHPDTSRHSVFENQFSHGLLGLPTWLN